MTALFHVNIVSLSDLDRVLFFQFPQIYLEGLCFKYYIPITRVTCATEYWGLSVGEVMEAIVRAPMAPPVREAVYMYPL